MMFTADGVRSGTYDMIVDGETATVWWLNACQYFKQRTLTVTSNAGNTQNFTRLHIKAHMIQAHKPGSVFYT